MPTRFSHRLSNPAAKELLVGTFGIEGEQLEREIGEEEDQGDAGEGPDGGRIMEPGGCGVRLQHAGGEEEEGGERVQQVDDHPALPEPAGPALEGPPPHEPVQHRDDGGGEAEDHVPEEEGASTRGVGDGEGEDAVNGEPEGIPQQAEALARTLRPGRLLDVLDPQVIGGAEEEAEIEQQRGDEAAEPFVGGGAGIAAIQDLLQAEADERGEEHGADADALLVSFPVFLRL